MLTIIQRTDPAAPKVQHVEILRSPEGEIIGLGHDLTEWVEAQSKTSIVRTLPLNLRPRHRRGFRALNCGDLIKRIGGVL